MSAYSALQGLSNLQLEEESDNDDIYYEKNSSDEDLSGTSQLNADRESTSYTPPPVSFRQPPSSQLLLKHYPQIIRASKFIPNDDNFIVSHNHIVVGLKVNEYILVGGQCKLTIQRGAIKVNNIHYLTAHPNESITIISTQAQSYPIIASTQVTDREGIIDTRNSENEHLFTSDYKSVVKLENWYSGLEKIAYYQPNFKRFIHNNQMMDIEDLGDHEKLFKTYSFEIVFDEDRAIGLNIDKRWAKSIQEISLDIEKDVEPKVIVVIGNKNSGKSTYAKLLMNSIILENSTTVSFMDIDPGQSEFSIPYTLSLTKHSSPILGLHIPSTPKCNDDEEMAHYYGFTTPQARPRQYISIVESLFRKYMESNRVKGHLLIINTPGWIKGLGREILNAITNFVEPHELIFLSNTERDENPENFNITSGMRFRNIRYLQGIFQAPRYLPFQLRTFNKLSYFHRTDQLTFDFENHILTKSPLKLSYQKDPSKLNFVGINMVTILNHDVNLNFNIEDLPIMIEATIMGIYLIDNELFSLSRKNLLSSSKNQDMPLYLDSSHFSELVPNAGMVFMGLCMVHSVNVSQSYINAYFQKDNLSQMKDMMMCNGYKMILVKGEGELPSSEFLMTDLLQIKENKLEECKKKKKLYPSDTEGDVLPYVAFGSKSRVGGTWRIRRNVKRRTQLR